MLGERVLELARLCSRRALIVAPFIKQEALRRVLAALPSSVAVTCVTRWRPEEIAAGVSDPEVWPLIRSRQGSLLLCHNLHAKLYVFDDSCLVGSANVTAAALGWREPSNLEILIAVSATAAEVQAVATRAVAAAVEVDDRLFAAAVESARKLQMAHVPPVGPDYQNVGEWNAEAEWLPCLRSPEVLFDAYCGDWNKLTQAAIDSARKDLVALRVPRGLDRRGFECLVAVRLLQAPTVAGVDRFLGRPRRFGEMRHFLEQGTAGADADWDRVWQTLMRWLRHFIPDRYVLSVPHVSEVMVRKDALERAQGRAADETE